VSARKRKVFPSRDSKRPTAEDDPERCWWFCLSNHEWRRDLNVPADEVLRRFADHVFVRKHTRAPRPEPAISTIVNGLESKATAYAATLARLVASGSEVAQEALDLLEHEARAAGSKLAERPDAVREALQRAEACPMNLDPISRFKLDKGFGQYALELLPWLWSARRHPEKYEKCNMGLNVPFDRDSVSLWWQAGRMMLSHAYPCSQAIAEFRSLVNPRFYGRDPREVRNRIFRGLWKRFTNFAAPRKAP
jgi:hypothetical protein